MLFLLWMTYILLCVRIRVQLEAELTDEGSGAALCVSILGGKLRRDFEIVRGKYLFSLRAVHRHNRKRKKEHPASACFIRLLRDYAIDTLRRGRFEHLAIHVRLGLGDACGTAVAAGAVHALICALLVSAGHGQACDLRIVPEFSGLCLQAHLQGIFSCQAGNIIFASLQTARRNRKEGSKWISTLLRA